MLTEQANDSWRACFATRSPPCGAGIKGEYKTHNSFLHQSRAFQRISESVCKTANGIGVTAHQWRLLSSAASDGVLQLFIMRSRCDLPWALQRLSKRVFFLKEQSKRAHERRLLFKDGFPLVCFWMWSFPGFI